MKLLERKTFPKITLSVSGKILHMNLEAKRELSTLSLGQSILEIIDANVIRKLSMYKKRIEFVKIESPFSSLVALKISGKARTKIIEATFLPLECVEDEIVGLYSDKNMPKNNTCVDISEIVTLILTEIEQRREHLALTLEAHLESTFVKLGAPQAEMLILTSIMALGEISSDGKIEINDSNATLEFSIDYRKLYAISSIFDLLSVYPQLYSKLLLLEAICEDEFISFGVSAANGKLSFEYKIPAGNKNELIVKRKLTSEKERINAFIDTLSAKNEKTL